MWLYYKMCWLIWQFLFTCGFAAQAMMKRAEMLWMTCSRVGWTQKAWA